MDRHFETAPMDQNLPVLLGLTGIWRRNAMGWPSAALIPYDQRLDRLPAYLQQLDMESNGKRVTLAGDPVARGTGPLVWGEPGTNAQHSFFQLLHQGTDTIPVDFLLAANPRRSDRSQHAMLAANCLAQAQALAFGQTAEEAEATRGAKLAPHCTFPGDRPSTTILYSRLDAFSFGRLVALFEHKVFVMGAIWGINSFDQFGVELGKVLAAKLVAVLEDSAVAPSVADASTAGLIARFHSLAR